MHTQLSSVLYSLIVLLTAVSVGSSQASADVVINEIFYNSPDDLNDLEYVELVNSGEKEVDVSNWRLSGEIKFKFPSGTILKPGQFVVIAKDPKLLREFYQIEALGEFKKSLSNSGGELSLRSDDGKIVEVVTYRDKAPWPLSADGYSASIERISTAGSASNPANWAPSRLSDNYDRTPSGSPGKANSVAAAAVPPSVASMQWSPKQLRPGESLDVKIKLEMPESIVSAELRYRHVGPGIVGKEESAVLQRQGDMYVASITADDQANRLLRFRVVCKSKSGVTGYYPHPNEVRPAYTVYVGNNPEAAAIPIAQLFFVGKEEYEAGEQYRRNQSEPARRNTLGFPSRRPDFGRNIEQRSEGRQRERGGFPGRPGGFGPPGMFGGFPATPLLPQGKAALIYTDPKSGETQVYDFINIVRRKSGWKIRLHKDQLLLGMKTINVLYESDERTVLNEVLSYQLYELAGNKTCRNGFTRLIINGQPAGYHLYFEQPNGSFFSRNGIDNKGDLYKLIWMGNAEMSPRVPAEEQTYRRDITGRYEKKSNRHDGHQDLVAVIEALESARSDEEMWRVIEENFDVDQMINYYAVNSLISHWDGFFNNFFVYFDRNGTGKWTMYPWDQDSTWSQRGGPPAELHELPLFFGAEGATPNGIVKPDPNQQTNRNRGFFGGFGFGGPGRGRSSMWWRPGGDFSRPMLANPTFYKRFLARLDELTSDVFTEQAFGPRIDALRTLEPEIRLRAKLRNVDEDAALAEFHQSLTGLHEHLTSRRAFVRKKLADGK